MTHANQPTGTQPKPTGKSSSHLGHIALQRSWRKQWIYPLLFLLAMLLSLSTYLTLDSIQRSVDGYVADNQRALVGGDLILTSRQDWDDAVTQAVSAISDDNKVYDYQFNAMVSTTPRLNGAVTSPALDPQSPLASQATESQATEARATASQATPETTPTTISDATLLSRIKSVSKAYPLYGEVTLASGKPLWQQLQPHTVVVEAQVLTGLGVKVGDRIRIGEADFIICDELLSEPDRPLTAFGFGARVMMSHAAVAKTQLMGQRSRINYRIEIAGSPDDITAIHARLKPLAESRPEITLKDSHNSKTSLSTISDNVLDFLKLLVIAVLFLAAVANLSVINAFVDTQKPTTAMRRALGESVASIKQSYYRMFLLTTLLGFVGSVFLSLLMLHAGSFYLAAVLPDALDLSINPLSILKVGIVALVLTLLMLQHSLHAVTHTKPSAVLKQDTRQSHHRPSLSWYALALLLAFALMAYEFGSVWLGIKILGGMLLLVGSFWLLAKGWLALLGNRMKDNGAGKDTRKLTGKVTGNKSSHPKTRQSNHWMRRTAIHNLSRKGNKSALFFVTLALSVAMLSVVTLLNHSLTSQFINAYPDDAPNLFLLDIQSDQHKQLNAMLSDKVAEPLTYYPVVRARISDVNGTVAKDIKSGTGDDPTRVFNLSYADRLLKTEFIQSAVKKNALYAPVTTTSKTATQHQDATVASETIYPMSIIDTAADMLGAGLGDRVRFNIQGIEIVGEITSIRERFERGPTPFFYFLFEPKVLADAPQLQFATAQVEPSRIPQLQTDLAKAFPAMTSIDGAAVAKRVEGFVAQMSQLVFIFTLLALFTGVMVLVTSLLATSQDRLRDSASFRLLGMQTRDLYLMNCLEIGLLGISAGLLGVGGASIGAWVVITQWFDLRFAFPWQTFLWGALALLTVLFVIALSYVRFVIGRGIMTRVRKMV